MRRTRAARSVLFVGHRCVALRSMRHEARLGRQTSLMLCINFKNIPYSQFCFVHRGSKVLFVIIDIFIFIFIIIIIIIINKTL